MRSPTKPSLAGLLATITVLATAGAVAATTVPDDDAEVVLIDEGSADDRLDLFTPMVVGTTAHAVETTRTSGTLHATGAQSIDEELDVTTTVEQTVEVVEVTPDGGYTLIRTVDSYDLTITSGSAETADSFKTDEELEALVGVSLEQSYDATGRLREVEPVAGTTLTADQQASIDVLLEQGSEQPFPGVEVGVGAEWTAEMPDSGGATATFELESVLDGTAVITLSFEGDPAEIQGLVPLGVDDVSGTMTGTGSYTVNVANRLDTSSEFTLQFDIAMTNQDTELTMDLEMANARVVTIG